MPPILNQDIRERVRTTISKRAPQNTTKQIKLENIENFNNLSREGLEQEKDSKTGILKGEYYYMKRILMKKYICNIPELRVKEMGNVILC